MADTSTQVWSRAEYHGGMVAAVGRGAFYKFTILSIPAIIALTRAFGAIALNDSRIAVAVAGISAGNRW